MHTDANIELKFAFVATEEAVRKIWERFSSIGSSVYSVLRCSDEASRHFESLESLLAYENPSRAAIESLEISAHFQEHGKAMVVLASKSWENKIEVRLQGEEREVMSLRSDLIDIFHGMRAWYTPVAVIRESMLWFSTPALLFFLYTFYKDHTIPSAVLGASLAAIFVIWAAFRLRTRLFPHGTFAIGQGEKRHQLAEQIRWVVIVGLGVSLAGAAIWSVVTALRP